MISKWFSRADAANTVAVVGARSSGRGAGGSGGAQVVQLTPVSAAQQGGSVGLDVESILKGGFRRMPFPPGLTGENGGFALLTNGADIVCLRRNDMAESASGYFWVNKLRSTHPHAKLLDVRAEEMRKVESIGEATTQSARAQTNSNAQQQGLELIEEGLKADISDIHIDIEATGPRSPSVLVRFREHGELRTVRNYTDSHSVAMYQEVIRALYQNEANSVAAERNTGVISDTAGRFHARLTLALRKAEVRFEADTTSTGMAVNLRILSYEGKPTLSTTLTGLGFASSQNALMMQGFCAPHGLALCMGPTGAGKTSTVATALSMVPHPERQARFGMEQPPEISIPYMMQLAFEEDQFEQALRGVLRLDPDVVYAGEILNKAAAQLAVQAAMTGHLVPATLHANNVTIGLRRLVGAQGMAIPMEDICADDMLQIAMFQTLVPTLCPECKTHALPALTARQIEALEDLEIDPTGLYMRAISSCSHCGGRGIRKRTVLAEVVRPTPDFLAELLRGGVHAAMEVYRSTRTHGFAHEDQTGKNAFEHGLHKIAKGEICAVNLLTLYDVLVHPVVIQKRSTRARERAFAREAAQPIVAQGVARSPA